MASNYNQKSSSSGSREVSSARYRQSTRSPNRSGTSGPLPSQSFSRPQRVTSVKSSSIRSVRIGDLDNAVRAKKIRSSYRSYVIRFLMLCALVVAVFVAGIVVYNSSLFTIERINVTGVEHLSTVAMTDLAAVPVGTTLLRVDDTGIKNRLAREPWVAEVAIKRVFPHTLEIVITERSIAAVVDVPVDAGQRIETWAIAADRIWLMAIPDPDSEEAALIRPKVFEDAAKVLKITGVPYGISPVVGDSCTDENVNNALAIVDGFTTALKDMVVTVTATGTETTTLILDNGVEIAFGTAKDIRDKERVCLELLEKYENSITYINVRVVEKPTWRVA